MVACFRQGLVALPLHRAAAPDTISSCACGWPSRGSSCATSATPTCSLAAGWDGPTLTVPWGELPDAPAPPAAELEPDDPCLVTLTSGTAGEPKAVLHGQR